MSQHAFEVGDLVILQHGERLPSLNGMVGIVAGDLEPRPGFDPQTGESVPEALTYLVTVIGYRRFNVICEPHQLRPAEQPAEPDDGPEVLLPEEMVN
jgi:hypothetical protein